MQSCADTYQYSTTLLSVYLKQTLNIMPCFWKGYRKKIMQNFLGVWVDSVGISSKWQNDVHFLCDNLKYYTKLSNFCKRSFFDSMFSSESDKMTVLWPNERFIFMPHSQILTWIVEYLHLHTYILKYLHMGIWEYLHTCILANLHTCILAYFHTCITAYLHTCIPT